VLYFDSQCSLGNKKFVEKFEGVHPSEGARALNESGVGKIGVFRPTRCHISETVQDRTRLLLLIGRCLSAFDWYRNQQPCIQTSLHVDRDWWLPYMAFKLWRAIIRSMAIRLRTYVSLLSCFHFCVVGKQRTQPAAHSHCIQQLNTPICCIVVLYLTTIRLRYDDIPRRIRLRRKWSKLRFAFDSTAIRLRHDYDENLTCSFLLSSNRVEWKQARAIRRSRIVVVS